MGKSKLNFWSIVIGLIIIIVGFNIVNNIIQGMIGNINDDKYVYSDKVFSLITTPENKVLEDTLNKYAKKNGFNLKITYADNLDIVDKINSGEKYDAIWASNSIWLDMLNSSVSTSDLKSTSITPITFGIKKSKVEELGLKDKNVTMKMLLDLIKSGKLKFSMANPITTNSGASSYLNILTTLAGNPDVLTLNDLKNPNLIEDMKSFFTGLSRTSGDEDFLEKSFVNGDYDAAFTYESSIININKTLEKEKKETLYAIYPVDGVIICDSPLVYVNNRNDNKKKIFLGLQSYILEDDGQDILLNLGRRTWYGGTTSNAPKDVFKKEWGIDTSKYISPLKYPSQSVIKEALLLYQTKLRKPVHVVFCLDYSGSMLGEGMNALQDAMEFILSDEAKKSMIQFTGEDKIDVIAFGSRVRKIGDAKGDNTSELLQKIKDYDFDGATSLYPAAAEAINILKNETNAYNSSIILMTDGEGNVGTFNDLETAYQASQRDIPIYSITFGDASERQLQKMADLSNGKVFDGRSDLVLAFKTVRGYN